MKYFTEKFEKNVITFNQFMVFCNVLNFLKKIHYKYIMNSIQIKLDKLKNLFIDFDVFGDNYEELMPIYFEIIDSIHNKDDIKKLKGLKQQFLNDDLLYCDQEEIEHTQIFKIIDDIINELT